MHYAVISTTENLELSLYNESPYLMCLAWLARENKEYREFFKGVSISIGSRSGMDGTAKITKTGRAARRGKR